MPLALRRVTRSLVESPLRAFLVLASVAVTLYVVCAPLFAARYPPMTDLPFHAASSSILRHYSDPAWHFREQFTLRPLAVPYMLHYAAGAFFMLFLPPVTAVKAATALLLLFMPAGVAVLLAGMKRSPMGALLSLPFVYCSLTHWGFISHVAALGLFCMSIGFAMLLLDRPTFARGAALALSLILLFFAHIFRYPMGVAAVIGAGIFLYPATRRFWPLVPALLPSLLLFAIWLLIRPTTLQAEGLSFHLDLTRRAEMAPLLFNGFTDPAESEHIHLFARVALFVALASFFAVFLEGRVPFRTHRERQFAIGAAAVPLVSALVLLLLFFTLPMQIGLWWYVYPREITAAVFVGLACLPGLPRSPTVRAPLVTALAIASLVWGRYVARKYAEFDTQTDDFAKISAELPQAPRLLYLIHDHSGSTRTVSPFVHLPAWIQAEHGGWLSFHFVGFDAAPIVYRPRTEPGAVVPPKVGLRWEWNAYPFQIREHGAFFDWFLIRAHSAPDSLFRDDPTIERVDHIGKWWLYRRTP
ncbi:MAG: hypothetical protein R3F14_37645 [Polyangiaceae bacterium]